MSNYYEDADQTYKNLLRTVFNDGEILETRNHSCISHTCGLQAAFSSFPLVTLRRTAWKKAIKEMEWFMSGETKCPDDLKDWWDSQLNPNGNYLDGYATQMRHYGPNDFDQVGAILDALLSHPNSRRLVMTTWNPDDMYHITQTNQNPACPTSCHGTITQLFVRDNTLHMHTYQRSADMLLGVPHNWVQYWALLMYFAYHADLSVGDLIWTFGDAHIYDDPSHLDCAKAIYNSEDRYNSITPTLKYEFSGGYDPLLKTPEFKASDFTITGFIPDPVTTLRPKLF
jgi:thymidylate synthase